MLQTNPKHENPKSEGKRRPDGEAAREQDAPSTSLPSPGARDRRDRSDAGSVLAARTRRGRAGAAARRGGRRVGGGRGGSAHAEGAHESAGSDAPALGTGGVLRARAAQQVLEPVGTPRTFELVDRHRTAHPKDVGSNIWQPASTRETTRTTRTSSTRRIKTQLPEKRSGTPERSTAMRPIRRRPSPAPWRTSGHRSGST